MYRRFADVLLVLVVVLPASLTAEKARAVEPAEHTFAISPSWPAGVQAYIRQETSLLLWDVMYQYGQNVPAASGAYGPNVHAPRSNWFLEYQRAGGLDIIAGVLRADRALIDNGLRMFHFGLARQARNGSFPGSFQPFHGTALFLAEAAPALILLRYSPFGRSFAAEIAWQVPRMRRAEHFMVHSVGGPGRLDDTTKNHRYYEEALALQAVSVLSEDRMLAKWAAIYAAEGMRLERPNGVMPEDGGHDSGYQALGLTFALRYLALRGSDPALNRVVARGSAWELSRVRADGRINQVGDTRTAGCQERDPEGRCKSVFLSTIAAALARWAVAANDGRFARAALLVWRQNWASIPGDVLPKPGLTVTPRTIRPGAWLTVAGTGFLPREVVTVYLASAKEATITCDQLGDFGGHSPEPNAHFPVPALASGTYPVVVRGSEGTVRRTTIEITSRA